jgi:hypothetical protein
MEAAFLTTEVVGGFVGRALALVRARHSYADVMRVYVFEFDGTSLRRTRSQERKL